MYMYVCMYLYLIYSPKKIVLEDTEKDVCTVSVHSKGEVNLGVNQELKRHFWRGKCV